MHEGRACDRVTKRVLASVAGDEGPDCLVGKRHRAVQELGQKQRSLRHHARTTLHPVHLYVVMRTAAVQRKHALLLCTDGVISESELHDALGSLGMRLDAETFEDLWCAA